MSNTHLFTVATVAALAWVGGSTLALITMRRALLARIVFWLLSLAAISGSLWMFWVDSPGRNQILFLYGVIINRDPYHLAATLLGAMIGFTLAAWPWQSSWTAPLENWRTGALRLLGIAAYFGVFLTLGVLALNEHLKQYLTNRDLTDVLRDSRPMSFPAGFVVRSYKCQQKPIQIAADGKGSVFYCYRTKNGGVARIDYSIAGDRAKESETAWNLGRVFGIALFRGNIYVSRAGRHVRAEKGKLVEVPTGSVTLLRDLNGDGVMDYFNDIITGLPGSQGPDPLHQNNGLAFDAAGNLYVTVGVHANVDPPVSKFEGTILKAKYDGSGLVTFARGLRNPFDVVIGPDEQVFCTDNDIGFTQADELNHVIEGRHYGHPFVPGNGKHPPEFTPPIWIHKKSTLQGIAYTDSAKLPARYRGCLYVVSKGSGQVHQVRLEKHGNSYRATATPFARFPNALDISISSDGEFFIGCYESRTVYHLTWPS